MLAAILGNFSIIYLCFLNINIKFSDCNPKTPSKNALNREYASKLWNLSEKMVGLVQ